MRKRKEYEHTSLIDPDTGLYKAVIYIPLDKVHTNWGSFFHARIFFKFSNREGEGPKVAKGRQIELSHGSSLGYAGQTAAMQTE